ncbi:MAG: hypothetical protein COA57_05225 [Flavobacteriales bacterium]|nr:OmpA family protein [Bacteroidales bacterium AH-315-I05]PCJ87081.1 MAG: hypothetical protein COA57_05225 [Flavobacteriales bacterium]
MRAAKKFLLVFPFLLFTFILSAQIRVFNVDFITKNFNDKKELQEAVGAIEQGDKHFTANRFSKALPHYLEAYDYNPSNAMLNMTIGYCYLKISKPIFAIAYLGKAIELNPAITSKAYIKLGEAYQLNYEWDKAIYQYKKYLEKFSSTGTENKKLAQKKIKECEYGKQIENTPTEVRITNLGNAINSKYDEYGPLITADESILLFTSRKKNTTGGKMVPEFDYYFEDVYFSERTNEGWKSAENIGPPINTEDHDATVGLSPDGQRMFVFKNDKNNGNIYESVLDGDQWSKPVKLNENINSKYDEPTACYTFDGRTIIFVSNRPGGQGGKDIYKAIKGDDGDWGVAENLGPAINTEYDEDGIFMHPDGKTLYFSSKGHQGIGGFDIFKAIYNDSTQKWSKPENLGFPINTPADDIFFVLSADGLRGYYSSVQPGGVGRKDLYVIQFENAWITYAKTAAVLKAYYDSVQSEVTNLESSLEKATDLAFLMLDMERSEDEKLADIEQMEARLVSKKRELMQVKGEMDELSGNLDSLEMYSEDKNLLKTMTTADQSVEQQEISNMREMYNSITFSIDSIDLALKMKTLNIEANKEPPTAQYAQLGSGLKKASELSKKALNNLSSKVLSEEKELVDLKTCLEQSTDIISLMMNSQMGDVAKIRHIDSLELRVSRKEHELRIIKQEMKNIQQNLDELAKYGKEITKSGQGMDLHRIKHVSNSIASKMLALESVLASTKRLSQVSNNNRVVNADDLNHGYHVMTEALNKSNEYARELLKKKSGRATKVAGMSSLVLFKGIVTNDEDPPLPLEAAIEVMDNETHDMISEFKSNSATGKYLISLPSGKNYGITISAPGYLFYSENVNLGKATQYEERVKNIKLAKIEAGKKVVLNNIFFDVNKADVQRESHPELDRVIKLLKNKADLKIEVSGHTDNTGSMNHNIDLSKRRAKAVYDYIVKGGISESRLKYVGHGSNQPIAPNDTEEGRHQNRRTEFIVL